MRFLTNSAAKVLLIFELCKCFTKKKKKKNNFLLLNKQKKRGILQFPSPIISFISFSLHLCTHYVVSLAIAYDEKLTIDNLLTNLNIGLHILHT